MELRQVGYFIGIAQAGSFGKAPDELHVWRSPPAARATSAMQIDTPSNSFAP
jgi:DNA-binding transcriptional LysR family regulator